VTDLAALAPRVAEVAPFHVMELLARAQALESGGRDVVHMEVGEPDFPTPAPIVEAGRSALERGATRYTPALGLPALREAIAAHYRERHGLRVPASRVVVTPGASGALQLLMLALVAPGDEVILSDPGYPCNRHIVRLAEGRPVGIPVGSDTRYQPTPERVRRFWSPRSRVLLLASPSNPTGAVISPAELQSLHAEARELRLTLVVDEIYQGLVYDTPPATALALGEDVVVVNSFSKYYGMTGWRLGWMVAPQALVPVLERLAQNLFLCAPTPAQHAALVAFSPEVRVILEARREELQRRRDYLLPALRALGLEVPLLPQGAFYLYADVSRFTDDSFALGRDLLEGAGLAVAPGQDFGRYRAERHLRFAYTASVERLAEGVDRLRRHLARDPVCSR
jgi:aspartate/methionine/tyrosine aminotransferase